MTIVMLLISGFLLFIVLLGIRDDREYKKQELLQGLRELENELTGYTSDLLAQTEDLKQELEGSFIDINQQIDELDKQLQALKEEYK